MTTSAAVAPWELLSEHIKSDGHRRVLSRRYRLPSGKESDWEIFDSPAGVAILAVTDDDQVVLVRQFRPGPGEILWELPGGNVDPGEDIEAAARRELLEETGFSAESVEIVSQTWSAAYSNQKRYTAIAKGCKRVAEPTPDAEEFLEPMTLSLPEFVEHALSGNLTDTDIALRGLVALKALTPACQSSQAQ